MSSKSQASANKWTMQITEPVTNEEAFTYNVTSFNLPGISIGTSIYATPIRDIYLPGDSLEIDDINMEFIVDAKFESWLSIKSWIEKIRSQTQAGVNSQDNLRNINLLMRNNDFVPIFGIDFYNTFPYILSDVQLTTTADSHETIVATATFKNNGFDVKPL